MTLNIETVSAVNPLKTDTEKKEKVRAFFRQRQSKLSVIMRSQKGGGGGTWVNVYWVCADGLSEPLPHHSLFFGQL